MIVARDLGQGRRQRRVGSRRRDAQLEVGGKGQMQKQRVLFSLSTTSAPRTDRTGRTPLIPRFRGRLITGSRTCLYCRSRWSAVNEVARPWVDGEACWYSVPIQGGYRHTSRKQRQDCPRAVSEHASKASEECSEEPSMTSDPRRVHMLGRVAIWTYAGLAPRISGFKKHG